MDEHYRVCHLCEAMCGVTIRHQDGVIHSVKGDRQDPFSRGHICPKAVALKDIQDDPDRLRTPVKRVGERWESITWREAFSLVAKGWQSVRRRYGGKSLGFYAGNPTVHHVGSMLLIGPLIHALGARQRFSATSVDQLPAMLASLKMFGHQMLLPIPDIDRTDYFLCIGGNPAASNGSLMSAGDVMGRIRALRQRGGICVVVDPRRTETADQADEYIAIRPGTDVYMLAAMLQTIFANGWERPGRLLSLVRGWDEVKQLVSRFTPESVHAVTGISAEQIHKLAYEFSHASSAVAYGRVGACTQEHGGLTLWLIQVLNVVTGNLDREGGAMFTHPAIDLVGLGLEPGGFDRFRSRVRQLPEFGGEFPSVTLADEILTPGDGQIRALMTHAGNPVLSVPGGERLEKALASLEFMVSIDCYINETTRHAHVILPPSGPLEHGHFDLIFNMLAVRNVVRYSPPLWEKSPDHRHDFEIIIGIMKELASGSDVLERVRMGGMAAVLERLGIEGVLDLLLRMGPYGASYPGLRALKQHVLGRDMMKLWFGRFPKIHKALQHTSLLSTQSMGLSMERLRAAPHGLDLGPLRPALPERLNNRHQRIDLAPGLYQEAMSQLEIPEHDQKQDFILIGRRHMRSNNSWMHNSHRLVKGPVRCTLLMHPEDACKNGLVEGETVRVTSSHGTVELPLELATDMMPGVVSMPHGFGHHRQGTHLSVASEHAGVSLNDVLDPGRVDPLSGVAVLNGQRVRVSAPD